MTSKIREIFYQETILYYDGIVVFKALDTSSRVYLGLMIDSEATTDRFLVLEIKPDSDLALDNLRNIIEERPYPEWFLLQANCLNLDGLLSLTCQSGVIPEEYLPEKG